MYFESSLTCLSASIPLNGFKGSMERSEAEGEEEEEGGGEDDRLGAE